MKSIKKVRWVLITLAVAIILSKAIQAGMYNHQNNVDLMKGIVDSINSQLPMNVDSSTRCEKVTLEEKVLIYHMTIINYNEFENEKTELAQNLDNMIKSNACRDPNYLKFMNMGISIQINYKTSDNILITSITLPSTFCDQ
ncbi:hypothetical protein ACFL1I_05830 [Candidatus Omnitrophota bacterium]